MGEKQLLSYPSGCRRSYGDSHAPVRIESYSQIRIQTHQYRMSCWRGVIGVVRRNNVYCPYIPTVEN